MSVSTSKPLATAEERLQWLSPHLLVMGLPLLVLLGHCGLPALEPAPWLIAAVLGLALLVHAAFYAWRGWFYMRRNDQMFGLLLGLVGGVFLCLPWLGPVF